MTLPKIEELDLLHSKMCTAIGDPKRMMIMYALHEEPRHVTALAEALDFPQSTVSRHLAILRQRGLVTNERHGAAVIYRLTDDRIIGVLDTLRDLLRESIERQTESLG